jgi:hypothetical protein
MVQIPLWVYYAVMAASTAANYQAQRKTSEAQAGVMREERKRRSAADKANELSAQKTSDTLTGLKEKEDARAAELADIYQKQAPAPTTDAAGTRFLGTGMPTNSTETIKSTNDETARLMAGVNARGARMGALGAFSDVFNQGNLSAARNAQDIGVNSSLFRGWQQNAMPALLARASEAGRDWSTTADVLKLAASIMGPMAMGKGGADAAAGSTEGVLDQMGGTPKEFAGKDLFGMDAMGTGGFNPMSARDTASIADAANTERWMGLKELGITSDELVQPTKDKMDEIQKMLDPFWNMPRPWWMGRRPRQHIPINF